MIDGRDARGRLSTGLLRQSARTPGTTIITQRTPSSFDAAASASSLNESATDESSAKKIWT